MDRALRLRVCGSRAPAAVASSLTAGNFAGGCATRGAGAWNSARLALRAALTVSANTPAAVGCILSLPPYVSST